jgi:hypothetical protein
MGPGGDENVELTVTSESHSQYGFWPIAHNSLRYFVGAERAYAYISAFRSFELFTLKEITPHGLHGCQPSLRQDG